jgi:hypothetical protein
MPSSTIASKDMTHVLCGTTGEQIQAQAACLLQHNPPFTLQNKKRDCIRHHAQSSATKTCDTASHAAAAQQ